MTEVLTASNSSAAMQTVLMGRLTRFAQARSTPYLWFGYTLSAALVMFFTYSLFHRSVETTALGKLLHHAAFSFLLFSAWIVGPVLAGHRIARDRDTRAWEALALSPVNPRTVASGEVLGATLELGLLQSALVPISVVGWLLNAVDLGEIALAWCCVLVNASLCALTGLWLASSRASIVQLSVSGVAIAAFVLLVVSFGGSLMVSLMWPTVDAGWPVWLPSAWRYGPRDIAWFLALVWLPLVVVASFGWAAFEILTLNLTYPGLERSAGLHRWHVWMAVPLWTAALVPRILVGPNEAWSAYAWSVVALLMYGWLCAFLFARTPSQRQVPISHRTRSTLRHTLMRCVLVSAIQFAALAAVGVCEHLWRGSTASVSVRVGLSCFSAFSFLAITSGTLLRLRERRSVRFSRLAYLALSVTLLLVPIGLAAVLTLSHLPGAVWVIAFVPASSLLVESWLGGETSVVTPVLMASLLWLGLGVGFAFAGRKHKVVVKESR